MKITSTITFAFLVGVTMAGNTPAVTPAATTTTVSGIASSTCIEVSVETDATYCIEGPICSGSGDTPTGTLCPLTGAVAVKSCHNNLPSWTGADTCVAPSTAVCAKVKTGAWGCVYESASTGTPCSSLSLATESLTPCPTLALATESSDAETSTPCPTLALATESSDIKTPAPCPTLTDSSDTTTDSATGSSSKSADSTGASTSTRCPPLELASSNSVSRTDAKSTSTPCPSLPIASNRSGQTSTPCPSLPVPLDNSTSAKDESMNSDTQTISTYTAEMTEKSTESSGVPAEAVLGAVGAVAAVAAVGAFVVFKKRQRLESPSLYLGTPAQN